MITVVTIKLIKPNGGPVAFRCHLISQGKDKPYLVEYKDSDERVALPPFETSEAFSQVVTAFLDEFGKSVVMQAEEAAKSWKEPDSTPVES